MPRSTSNGGTYDVHCSGAIGRSLKQIQKRAKAEGRGELVLAAIRRAWHRLTYDPSEFGEPLYRLPGLRLEVRHGTIGPLLIYYGVSEDPPLVFIKFVKLLPEPPTQGQ